MEIGTVGQFENPEKTRIPHDDGSSSSEHVAHC